MRAAWRSSARTGAQQFLQLAASPAPGRSEKCRQNSGKTVDYLDFASIVGSACYNTYNNGLESVPPTLFDLELTCLSTKN